MKTKRFARSLVTLKTNPDCHEKVRNEMPAGYSGLLVSMHKAFSSLALSIGRQMKSIASIS
ncbi:hypothetical protein HOV93_00100 [Planctomycetes bacterium FF15]|uniref:Uncharacterized protein n=1 Tax=Bremerella alba TaxID=980252 RepID=A0A7V8V1C3_9BACT|nr:hypothetical protein [Bremerella alba]